MKILLLLILLTIAGCDSGVMWEHHPYEVHWIDSQVTLGKRFEDKKHSVTIGRVPSNVIAVGINEKFVVAKQRDPEDEIVYYFYIDRLKDNGHANFDEITVGPMSEDTFISLKEKMGFPDFSKEF